MTIDLPHSAQYREEFEDFADQDRRGEVPERPILFYGSSSIRLWESLAQDFGGLPVLNRGFGGSTLAECLALQHRLVTPYHPRAIVLYAGDNDLDQGAAPEEVMARFEHFMAEVRKRLSWTPVLFVSIKPSPSRLWNAAHIDRANALICASVATRWQEAHYLDLHAAMLAPDGAPRRELFAEDGLHLTPAGYALWTQAVRRELAAIGLHGES